jgi:hypothetical protein
VGKVLSLATPRERMSSAPPRVLSVSIIARKEFVAAVFGVASLKGISLKA